MTKMFSGIRIENVASHRWYASLEYDIIVLKWSIRPKNVLYEKYED